MTTPKHETGDYYFNKMFPDQTQPQPVPPAQKRPAGKWIVPFLVVGAVVTAVLIGTSVGSNEEPGTPAAPAETQLKQAHDSCSAGVLSDADHTMTLDMAGEDTNSGVLSFDQVTCVLAALGIPSSVASRMDATRALDGMQDGEWPGFHASWTYHPDNGLDIILTEG